MSKSDPKSEIRNPKSEIRPALELLSQPLLERIVAEALEVLEKVGVFVENREAVSLLAEAGARVEPATPKVAQASSLPSRVFLPEDLVWRCVRSAPSSIQIFDREGNAAMRLEGWNVHFAPGSAAVKVLDPQTGEARAPVTADLIAFACLTDALPHVDAQSTALVPADVPREIADRYRLYLILLHATKPVVTGTFTVEGVGVMKDMLTAVAGDERSMRERPMAIFDACPSPPLKWSELTAQSLLDCARCGLPAELISMPLLGATAPVTLTGALVQHTAENLSGVVIHQLAGEGSPIIYGGSPAAFDMRYGTTAMGAVETAMLICAYAQIGRFLGLPTHGYLGLSDAKAVDAQAGLESGLGAVLAALAGVNVVSGPGMLEFESCQSLEKLVIDDEVCGMAKRLIAGLAPRGERLAEDLFGDLSQGDHFLTSPTTLTWLRPEITSPSRIIDRQRREEWQKGGSKDALQNARERVQELLAAPRILANSATPLPDDIRRHLTDLMSQDAKRHGMERLPVEGVIE